MSIPSLPFQLHSLPPCSSLGEGCPKPSFTQKAIRTFCFADDRTAIKASLNGKRIALKRGEVPFYPDVWKCIANYLEKKELKSCLLVSRGFNAIFSPLFIKKMGPCVDLDFENIKKWLDQNLGNIHPAPPGNLLGMKCFVIPTGSQLDKTSAQMKALSEAAKKIESFKDYIIFLKIENGIAPEKSEELLIALFWLKKGVNDLQKQFEPLNKLRRDTVATAIIAPLALKGQYPQFFDTFPLTFKVPL